MINKPPITSNQNLDTYLREVWDFANNSIKIIDIPVSKSGIIGNYVKGLHPAKLMVAGDSCYFGFTIPYDVQEIKEVTIRFVPTTTGTMNWTATINNAAVGAAYNANTATKSVTLATTTNNLIVEADITSLFPAVAKNDVVGCQFTVDAFATTTAIDVISLYFKYI